MPQGRLALEHKTLVEHPPRALASFQARPAPCLGLCNQFYHYRIYQLRPDNSDIGLISSVPITYQPGPYPSHPSRRAPLPNIFQSRPERTRLVPGTAVYVVEAAIYRLLDAFLVRQKSMVLKTLGVNFGLFVQGYLAHKKQPPPCTLASFQVTRLHRLFSSCVRVFSMRVSLRS